MGQTSARRATVLSISSGNACTAAPSLSSAAVEAPSGSATDVIVLTRREIKANTQSTTVRVSIAP